MRLIDVDKLIEILEENEKELNKKIKDEAWTDVQKVVYEAQLFSTKEMIRVIKEQPTAFDVDRVISKIWDRSELIHIKHTHNYEIEVHIRTTDASEIVRAGGV